jgi:hypothetical protein
VYVFINEPEPENPIAKKSKDKIESAEDPEKFEEPFECLDM